MKNVELERRLEQGLVQSIFKPCAQKAMQFIESAQRILDVGCGSGIGARVAVDRFPAITHAHGFDFSENAIEVAKEVARGPQLAFWTDNAETFTVESPYDAVICQHTIQHVDDKRSAMRCMRDALRVGGVLVLVAWPELDQCPAYDFLYSAAGERDEKAKTLSTPLRELTTYAREVELEVERASLEFADTSSVVPEQFLTDYFESSAGWAAKPRPTIDRHQLYALAERLGWSQINPVFKIGFHVAVARRSA